LIERVAAEAHARSATAVNRLSIRIGELSGVDVDLFTTAYYTFRERTICADAELHVEAVPARWVCAACDDAIEPGWALRCRRCGTAASLVTGDELVLDRIEMEVP
jgi:hydrogenase nickel incorporation protein HypA/HybF